MITINSVSTSQHAIPIHLDLLFLQCFPISQTIDFGIALYLCPACAPEHSCSHKKSETGGERETSTESPELLECNWDTFSALCVIRSWHWEKQDMGRVEREAFFNSRCKSKKKSIASLSREGCFFPCVCSERCTSVHSLEHLRFWSL